MDEFVKSVVVAGVVFPLGTVINVTVGVVACLVVFFILRIMSTRHLRKTAAIDMTKGELNLAKWHQAQAQKFANKEAK